ncbi:MAG: DUF4838 domain-containing protein [bacterium]
MNIRYFVAVGMVLANFGKTDAADLVLAEKGRTDYQVVLPDVPLSPDIGESLKQVARLVQAAFKANGADVRVVGESARDALKPSIYLGDTAFARSHGVRASELVGWSYVHKVVGRDVIVAGREQVAVGRKKVNPTAPTFDRIGTAKAALDFLRLYVGTRFLYPDVSGRGEIKDDASVDWLKSPAVEFLTTAVVRVPSDLDVRKSIPLTYNLAWGSSAGFYDLATSRYPVVDEVWGGHTYGRAIPLETYRDTHPEYFALLGGKRLVDPDGMAQYCISNPEVQKLIFEDLISWLDAGYEAVDLGQPDGFRPCQCDNCLKLFGTGSDWGEKLWIFHRTMAEQVAKARPGKKVILMAYSLTDKPPKTFRKFPKNTGLAVSGTNEENLQVWRDYTVPAGFVAYIYNSTPNLGTRYTPMRTPHYVEAQAKRFVAYHIQSIYRDGIGCLFGLEGPVYYTMGRMFDDVDHNRAQELVSEFCSGAFGKASGPMLRFYDQLYHGIELYSEFLGTRCPAWSYTDIYGRSRKFLTDPFQFLGFIYTPTLLAALEKELSQAEKTAETDKVKARLSLVRREFNYVKSLARVIHLYHAYEILPDQALRDRLLDAIDARNAEIASLFESKGPKALPGWAITLFPLPGHNANHLRLYNDGYQEPFKNTCLNWDTKAMRRAPLSGVSRVGVKPATGVVSLDSAEWDGALPQVLEGLPRDTRPNQRTVVRVLYDSTSVYFRLECDLPAVLMAKPAEAELFSIYLAPSSGRDIGYRFTVGPRADSKVDAASGFIADVMDPRYGQFDPDWSGAWSYETRLEPEKNRWLGLVKVPFKSLGVLVPANGTLWRGNFGRTHVGGSGKVERSLWSALGNTKDMDDRTVFGEISFEAEASMRVAKHPLNVSRDEYSAIHGDIPAEWKGITNSPTISLGSWLFRADPGDQGGREGWYAPGIETADWVTVAVPAYWAETEAVGNYQGYGWCRTTFVLPAEWKGRRLRLLFGAVDEQAWVYVNGRLVKEHSEKSEGKGIAELCEEPFAAEVPPQDLEYGKVNTLVVRVHNSIANGGIWRRVLVQAEDAK